jgi:hypothetical protein
MSVSLDELLALVGRLDDAPGFDTPRERFRRFLLERVTDVQTARGLIEECQRAVGEQRHRALEDLVVVVGRLLQFEITFGAYERSHGGSAVRGHWRSPGMLAVVLETRTEQTAGATMEDLAHAIAGAGDVDSRIGLCVVTRRYAARGGLIHALAVDETLRGIRVVSVQSLLSLAALVAGDRLTHADVVKLLQSGFALDFAIDLLDRPAVTGQPSERIPDAGREPPTERREPRFWVAIVTGNEAGAPERLLQSVIVGRRVLAVSHAGQLREDGAPGDWVCFFLPAKGIVGHAQMTSVFEESASAGVVRHASRFNRVYRLGDVTLYEPLVVQAARERRFVMPQAPMKLDGASLLPVSKQAFLSLTTHQDEGARTDLPRSETA